MAEQKRYVIWEGKKKGIFSSWDKVKPLVTGIKGAKYKSFKTASLAQQAWEQ
ncbi:MAG: RNase H1/viroplasmin domain-containing protein [bacterium]|nr:RNase H1/viroplasmin domain-containing protein [bacterium]